MAQDIPSPKRRRSKSFERTHKDIVEQAVRLLAEKGENALSVAELARNMGVDRTTIYYHFANREALLDAVMAWSSDQLTSAFGPQLPAQDDAAFINRFVLDNPDLIKLWIGRLISHDDIRESYPEWDKLIEMTGDHLARSFPDEKADVEIFCVILLMTTIIGPRIFHNSVDPASSIDDIVGRFRRELNRILRMNRP